MPFVPLTTEEREQRKPPCRDPQHFPPNMIVVNEPRKWVCPACGQQTIVSPPRCSF